MNGRKRSVALDLRSRDGIRILRALVRHADVVIEASRPRALAQFGLDGPDLVRESGPQVWVSITGYGRSGEAANRVVSATTRPRRAGWSFGGVGPLCFAPTPSPTRSPA